MSKALIRETFRSISKTKTRFISIIAIVALGISFFVGVNVTGTVMRNTADSYFNDTDLMDINVVSNLGLTDNDLNELKKVEGVADVMPGKYVDANVEIDGNKVVDINGAQFKMRVRSLNIASVLKAENGEEVDGFVNKPILIEGRWPQKSGECVLDSHVVSRFDKFKIGTTFQLSMKDSDVLESLVTKTYTVVGFVDSSYYVSAFNRDQTTTGKMSAFIYVPDTDLKADYYTEIFIKAENPDNLQTFSDEYVEYIETIKKKIETVSVSCLEKRSNEIKTELEKQIAEGEAKLAKEEPKALAEIEKSKAELEELREKYLNIDSSLAEGKAKIDAEFQKLYDSKNKEYQAGLAEWETKKAEFDKGKAELDAAKVQLDYYKQQIDANSGKINLLNLVENILDAYENGTLEENLDKYIAEAEAAGQTMIADSLKVIRNATSDILIKTTIASIRAMLTTNQQGLSGIRDKLAQYEAYEKQYNEKAAEMAGYEKQLNDGKAKLDEAKVGLEQLAVQGKAETQKAKENLEVEVEKFKAEFPNIEKQYLDGITKGENELKNARTKIADAREMLKSTEDPQWYITDRKGAPGYEGFADSADQIETIAKVFPVFFFLVAVLVCLTTMTRMVEEERTQLGTLKALGYSEKEIAGKYALYAFLASSIGSVFGFAIGFTAFPIAIFEAYKIMYNIPSTELTFSWLYATLGFVIAAVLTIMAALIVCMKDLKIVPAQLMRPKAPKAGKRVLLEKIPFLWKHFNFTTKVTIRNLLRNKKRFFMTIFGVAGCAALLLTGLGLNDSVNDIVGKQYNDGILKYDFQLLLSNEQEYVKDKENFVLKEIVTDTKAEQSRISDAMLTYYNTVKFGNVSGHDSNGKPISDSKLSEIYLIVPQTNETLSKFVDLRNRVTEEEYKLNDNGILITEKAAKTFNVSAGDTIYITKDDGKIAVEVPVAGIVENYCMSYIYMSPELYSKTFNEKLYYNYIFGTLTDEVKENAKNAKGDTVTIKSQLADDLANNNNVVAVVFTEQFVETFEQIVSSLSLVVAIFIVGAIALALVVLNNLTNVNISERIREIATIKVLGFYDKEVSAYIYRENIVLSIIGTILGIVGGIFLHEFVVWASEVEGVMFGRDISVLSFILAVVITIIISIVVNVMTHFTLKKVDMVESMKSIE